MSQDLTDLVDDKPTLFQVMKKKKKKKKKWSTANGRVNSAIFSLGTTCIMQEAIIWICVDQDLRCIFIYYVIGKNSVR